MKDNLKVDRLQHCWLQQLNREFEDICWNYKIDLKPPIFEISDTEKELGGWCSATRTLRLSRQLICNYPWSVTLQVLKHEMAHQLCSEKLPSARIMTAHDHTFQEACEMLGVLPEFRRSGTSLVELVDEIITGSEPTERGRKCMVRVKKLLALAESSNEHEAALAIQKANELLEKHNLEGYGLGKEAENRYTFAVIDRKRKRIESYQRHICLILQEFFFVRVVISNLYDPVRNDTFKTIELLGSRENVTVAEYCYYFLENRLISLWARNRQRFKGSVRTEKISFFLGILRGFYQKLQDQQRTINELQKSKEIKEKHPNNEMGELIVANEKQLEIFVGIRFPRLKKTAARESRVYGKTYGEGVETGKTISFTEGLTASDAKSQGFLT